MRSVNTSAHIRVVARIDRSRIGNVYGIRKTNATQECAQIKRHYIGVYNTRYNTAIILSRVRYLVGQLIKALSL